MYNLIDFPLPYSSEFKLSVRPSDEQLQDLCFTVRDRVQLLVSEKPVVSVVFPAFNEELYLPLMLWALSKISTTYAVEFIGVNNASTDRTGDIITQCGIFRIDEPQKGVSYARQAGLEGSKGEIIATTDADSQMLPSWIDSSMGYFMSDSDLMCFSGGSEPQGGHISYWIIRNIVRNLRKLTKVSNSGLESFPGHNMFYRREQALSIGGYELGTDLGEDNLLARKLKAHGRIKKVEDDFNAKVVVSARRISTLGRVLKTVSSRIKTFNLDYDKYNTRGETFMDIR